MTQIAEMVGMHKSTVHRFLATLEKNRFLEREPVSGIYKPGIRLLQLAYLSLEQNDLRRWAAPHLRRLCEQSLETVDLAVLDGQEVVYLDVIESPQRVKLAAAIGFRLPAYCTASGKAILAFMPESAVLRALPDKIIAHTQNTLTTPDAILGELKLIRDRGVAFSEQEFETGINAVGAPILDFNNRPVGSIAITGPAYRLTRERIIEFVPLIKASADLISKEVSGALLHL